MTNLEKAYDILAKEYTELVCDPAYFTLCKICVVRNCHGKPNKETCKEKIKGYLYTKVSSCEDAEFTCSNMKER